VSVPHSDPKPLEPWAVELLRKDFADGDPEAQVELARVVALLRSLPEPMSSPDLVQQILERVAAEQSRPRVVHGVFGALRFLSKPQVGGLLAAGIAALYAVVLAPGSTPSVLRVSAESGDAAIAQPARRRAALIRPHYVTAALSQTSVPVPVPRFRPERAPIEDSIGARLDHQLNQLMMDPTAFAMRLAQLEQPDQFIARLADRAAERGDAAEIAFRVRESPHPLAGQLVERMLRAKLVASVSPH
jgi:hypothetical protein